MTRRIQSLQNPSAIQLPRPWIMSFAGSKELGSLPVFLEAPCYTNFRHGCPFSCFGMTSSSSSSSPSRSLSLSLSLSLSHRSSFLCPPFLGRWVCGGCFAGTLACEWSAGCGGAEGRAPALQLVTLGFCEKHPVIE